MSKKILIADHNSANSELVEIFIKRDGKNGPYDIIKVSSGLDALKMLMAQDIGVAFVRQGFNDMTGEEIYHKLNGEEKLPDGYAVLTGDVQVGINLRKSGIEAIDTPFIDSKNIARYADYHLTRGESP